MNKYLQKENIYISSILNSFNFIVLILLISTLSLSFNNPYINQFTIFIDFIFVLLNVGILSMQSTKSDPFALIFNYFISVYFNFRIVTLAFFSYSDVLDRHIYNPTDSNFSISFILVASLLINLGFKFVKHTPVRLNKKNLSAKEFDLIFYVICFIFLITCHISQLVSFISSISSIVKISPRIISISCSYLNKGYLFFVLILYLLSFKERITKKHFYITFFLLTNFIFNSLLEGSKGIFIFIFEIVFLLSLITEHFSIKRKIFRYLKYFFLIFLTVTFLSFSISLQQRTYKPQAMSNMQFYVKNIDSTLKYSPEEISSIAKSFFSRGGYYDFASELISSPSYLYSNLFTFSNYYKSIVDNVLTPGFDLYDVPKISNLLVYRYKFNIFDKISKRYLNEQGNYNSDQITIFAEFELLFGYLAFPLFFCFALSIKWLYFKIQNRKNNFSFLAKRFSILLFFTYMVNSFGFDWSLAQILPLIFWLFLFSFFINRKLANSGNVK